MQTSNNWRQTVTPETGASYDIDEFQQGELCKSFVTISDPSVYCLFHIHLSLQ